MIKINKLNKYFGAFQAVKDLSFEVQPGEVLGFLGPNGAGKSTTMKMLTGFLTPSSGTIEVMGHQIEGDALEAKRIIGYLPEGAPLYADMTPVQFLEFVAEVRGFAGAEKQERVASVIAKLSLQNVLHQPIDTLSKGFKRRVGIAQAILHDPDVLVLDEPTDGLDPNQKHQVRELIKNLSKDKIVIISTHILEEVEAVCTRAIIIAHGRLVCDETPAELRARSKYHHALTVKLKNAGDVEPKLSALSEVDRVEMLNGDGSAMTLFPKENVNLYESVNKLIQQEGWEVDSMHTEQGRLDDVFRSVTASENRGDV